MPRRKQEAPKRAPVYSPEDVAMHSVDTEETHVDVQSPAPEDDLPTKEEFDEQRESPVKDQTCERDSAGETELPGQDMDSESHVSETSDHLSDFESPPRKPDLVTAPLNGCTKTPL
ncbi:hypothetical protein WMY93_023629 [Mugilogobius chulae]|uniref:Uncharacterized protein n=1 Tax=Mugilogobius chulae TaxID=88201 RepID=A0AAW0N682_9GOBI